MYRKLNWWMLVVGIGLVLASQARAADVPTYNLEALTGGQNSKGNGFVVEDWRAPAGSGALLLVTALHVIYRSTTLAVFRVDCEARVPDTNPIVWTVTPEDSILVWPELDLAAIPIPRDRQKRMLNGQLPGQVEFSSKVDSEATVHLHATSSLSPCQGGPGFVMGTPLFQHLVEDVARRSGGTGEASEQKLRGSLDPNAALIQYFSPAAPGASGGPVTLPGVPRKVLGIHDAGHEGTSVSWAIAFYGLRERLATAAVAHLRGMDWPEFKVPDESITQSQSLKTFPDELQDPARRWTPGQRLWGVTALLERGLWGHSYVSSNRLLRLHGSAEFLEFPPESLASSLGVRVAAGIKSAPLRERYEAPTGQSLAEADVSSFGPLVELDLQLRFARQRRISYAVGAGGRIWFASYKDAHEQQTLHWAYGVPVFAQLVLSPTTGSFALMAEVSFLLERAPSPTYRYTGVSAEVVPQPAQWGGGLGLGLGVQL